MLGSLWGIARKRFVRDVAKVVGGVAAAQAITLAFAPVITRLYGPEPFGILGLFMSIVAVLTPIAGLTYPIAIVLPKSDADARGLVRLSQLIALVTAAVVGVILVMFSDRIVSLFGLERIAPFIFLLPLLILFTTFLATAQQWLIRTGQFTLLASVASLQALAVNVAKVGLGLVQPLASSLVAVSAAGILLHAGVLTLGSRRGRDPPGDSVAEPWKSLTELARIYRDFPLLRAPQELVNALSLGLPVVLLAGFYSPTVVGFYTLAYSVLMAPIILIGRSVGNVLYPRLAEASNQGRDLKRLVALPTGALFLIGLVPFGTVMAIGPAMFGLVFGAEWREAGEYAGWLALWTLFGFANIPSVKVTPVINAQGLLLSYGIVSLVLRASSVVFSYYYYGDPLVSMIFIGISGAIANIMLVYWVIRKLYR